MVKTKGRVISKPGACLEVRVLEMPPHIQRKIERSLRYGVRAADPAYPSSRSQKIYERMNDVIKTTQLAYRRWQGRRAARSYLHEKYPLELKAMEKKKWKRN